MNASEDTATEASSIPADANPSHWVDSAPSWAEPYLRLSRFDRPVGFWLLALPCFVGMSLARLEVFWPSHQAVLEDILMAVLFSLGAVAMRGAGCTWNDILDRKIDAQVSRTAGRPLPAGRVSVSAAMIWLLVQCLIGLAVLLSLPNFAKIVALLSIPLVALYPLMKRITWWPQIWLGMTFNWGALVAPAAIRNELTLVDLLVYVALILWTLGYDTIYALQDKEDDAMVGVKSTARRFGEAVQPALLIIYAMSTVILAISMLITQNPAGLLGVVLFGGHLALQAVRVRPDLGEHALGIFKSNRDAGLVLVASWLFAAIWF